MRSFKAGFGGFDEGVWMVKCWGVKGNPRLDCLNKTGKDRRVCLEKRDDDLLATCEDEHNGK